MVVAWTKVLFRTSLGLSKVFPSDLSAYLRSNTYLNSSESSLLDKKIFFHCANGKVVFDADLASILLICANYILL